MNILCNDILFLRAVEPEDLKLLYKWENDTSLWTNGNTLNPYSHFTIKIYIERCLTEDVLSIGQVRLMICIKKNGMAIGMIDIFDIDTINSRGGLGLFIDNAYRGLGFSDMAIQLVEVYAREILLLHQLYAHIAIENHQCIKCFKRNGFSCSSVLRDWKKFSSGYSDVYVYQKFL